jgi:hypothetical protein
MPTRIFYRPKNFPKYITSSKPFAEWVAQWKGPEGIKPPGHGQVEVGRVNAEDVFVHSIETHAAKAKQAEEIDGLYGSGGAGEATWASRLGLENKVRETPHAVTKGVYSGDDPTGIGAYTSDLFDIGGPRSRVPIGSSVYDPKNLIKWGALGAGIAGTAVASDALASSPRVSVPQPVTPPIKRDWRDPIGVFNETFLGPQPDQVGEFVAGAAGNVTLPSFKDVGEMFKMTQGATSWGAMPSQIASKVSSDIQTQLAQMSVETGIPRAELLKQISLQIAKSPRAWGALATILAPGAGKHALTTYRDFMPPHIRGWIHGLVRNGADMTYLSPLDRRYLNQVDPLIGHSQSSNTYGTLKDALAEGAVREQLAKRGIRPKGNYDYPVQAEDPRNVWQLTGKTYIEDTPEGRKLQDFYHFWPGDQNLENIPFSNIRQTLKEIPILKAGARMDLLNNRQVTDMIMTRAFPWLAGSEATSIDKLGQAGRSSGRNLAADRAARIIYRKAGKPYLINASLEPIPPSQRTWLQKLYWKKLMGKDEPLPLSNGWNGQ